MRAGVVSSAYLVSHTSLVRRPTSLDCWSRHARLVRRPQGAVIAFHSRTRSQRGECVHQYVFQHLSCAVGNGYLCLWQERRTGTEVLLGKALEEGHQAVAKPEESLRHSRFLPLSFTPKSILWRVAPPHIGVSSMHCFLHSASLILDAPPCSRACTSRTATAIGEAEFT